MSAAHNPKARFGMSLAEATSSRRFNPSLANAPPLPPVDFGSIGKTAPTLPNTPTGALPQAAAVVICWTEAEWAALQQVFCGGTTALPYSARTRESWPGWHTCTMQMPNDPPRHWDNWGSYRLVGVNGAAVLLFKSNTHLDFPGASYLESLVQMMIADAQPELILSTGTAGGAKPGDHVGTVRAVSAGTLYQPAQPQAAWPIYKSAWRADVSVLNNGGFGRLLNPVPTTATALTALCGEFNQYYGTNFTLQNVDPNGLNMADPAPAVDDQTGGGASLLTTPSFVVATTAGNLGGFTSVEMDDAIIGKACGSTTNFGFIRNISDPAQALPQKIQGHWGSAVYDVFGFYTSYNSALAWAMLQ